MGRKQNPLIETYFHRGSKHEDGSNRYEHTCKGCRRHFPKGRFEALVNHLLNECPAITAGQRQELALQAHSAPLPNAASAPGPGTQTAVATPQINTFAAPAAAPAQYQTAFNGLNMLAKAASFGQTSYAQAHVGPRGGVESFDATSNDDDAFTPFVNIPDDHGDASENTFSLASTGRGATGPFGAANGYQGLSIVRSASFSARQAAMKSQRAGLESIAASASQLVAGNSDFNLDNMTDEEALLFTRSVEPTPSFKTNTMTQSSLEKSISQPMSVPFKLRQTSRQPITSPWEPRDPSDQSARLADPAAPTPQITKQVRLHSGPDPELATFVTESGTLEKSQKPHIRSNFTPGRREEVLMIRRMGACLRCRILKKTCSGGDPCAQCLAVDNPRIWKARCVRGKLANMFTLFNSEVPSLVAHRRTLKDVPKDDFEPLDAHIEAFHLDNTPHILKMKALRLKGRDTQPVYGPVQVEAECGFLKIDTSTGDSELSLKMEQYLQSVRPHLLATEASTVLKATLDTAQALLRQQTDSILERLLELWSTIMVLLDKRFEFKLNVRPNVSLDPATSSHQLFSGMAVPLTHEEWPETVESVKFQLLVAVNRHASSIAKDVMKDLEGRLMQKPPENQFATFLAMILMVNCIERLSWEYTRFSDPSLRSKFPFVDKSPATYAEEGQAFMEVADSLLEIRGATPKLAVHPITKIVVPAEKTDEAVLAYFEQIAITHDYIKTAPTRPPIVDDYRSLDGVLFSRLLRPYDPEAFKGGFKPMAEAQE